MTLPFVHPDLPFFLRVAVTQSKKWSVLHVKGGKVREERKKKDGLRKRRRIRVWKEAQMRQEMEMRRKRMRRGRNEAAVKADSDQIGSVPRDAADVALFPAASF